MFKSGKILLRPNFSGSNILLRYTGRSITPRTSFDEHFIQGTDTCNFTVTLNGKTLSEQ